MTWIELGEEVHDDRDQFFQVEKGEVVTDVRRSTIKGDDAIIISAGARRNIMNTGEVLAAMHRLCAAGASRRHGASGQSRRKGFGRAF